jgi:CRISPR/Cas system CMR-associated protein Cmr5 small subunit
MAKAAANIMPEHVSRELRTRYRQLRIMLHSAGLAATFAFIASKTGEGGELAGAYRRAGEGICARLIELGLLTGDANQMSTREMLKEVGRMTPVQYARASAEASAFVSWLSRLADAMRQAEAGQ